MWFIENMKNKISEHLLPDNQKSYEKFSEAEKKEMLESLSIKDDFDLYSINLKNLSEPTISMSIWDTVDFKKWSVKKDKFWKYILVKWMKCRKYQPGISWFVYEDIRDHHYPYQWLKMWFCDKWNFKKYVIINENGKPKTFGWMPNNTQKKLWWPFYEIEDINSIKENPLFNISWDAIYTTHNGDTIISNAKQNNVSLSNNWENKNGELSLNIEWIKFKPFKEWISWFVYQEFSHWHDNCILLAEYKDWKMIWDWVILKPTRKSYITSSIRE